MYRNCTKNTDADRLYFLKQPHYYFTHHIRCVATCDAIFLLSHVQQKHFPPLFVQKTCSHLYQQSVGNISTDVSRHCCFLRVPDTGQRKSC